MSSGWGDGFTMVMVVVVVVVVVVAVVMFDRLDSNTNVGIV